MDLELRFLKYVSPEPNTGCWLWQGYTNRAGYGAFQIRSKISVFAHRASWEIFKSKIPKRLYVCHKCDTPSCVNPDHLFLGSNSDNQKDSVIKKRHHESRKILCKRSHPLIGSNLKINPNGSRQCRKCCVIRNRKYLKERQNEK